MQSHYWLLQDLDTKSELVFTDEHLAMHAAEKIVGNRSFAKMPDGYFYGPGDGTTRIMVRRFTRELILAFGHNLPA